MAPIAVVLLVAVLVYGIWRFRVPGDVAACLLAGVGADALIRRHLEGGAELRTTDGLAGASPGGGTDDQGATSARRITKARRTRTGGDVTPPRAL